MNYSETSSILKPYDNVLTIKTVSGDVPVYKLMEKFFFIKDKNGQRVPFRLNAPQCEMYKAICEQRLAGKPIRQDYLKARQLGASTFIDLLGFAWVIFTPGREAAIVADIAEHASNLFEKFNYVYDNLPEELKPRRVKSNAKELVVQYANGQKSSVRIMVQGESAGRSGTYQYLHLSECAFWGNLNDTLISLLQTVSNENLDSMVFLETTANGVNEYKQRWDKDWAGNSPYVAKFFGWYVGGDYAVKDWQLRDYKKPDWLIELQTKHGLNERQCQWYYDKFLEFGGDLDKLRQEFPSNPIEAFITTGNSVFNASLLQKRKLEILENVKYKTGQFTYRAEHSLDGKRIDLKNVEFVEGRNGSVKIFKDVEPGHPYVVSNDPANGGEDYFATHVFDNYTGEQVAVYHKNKCDADDAAYQMYCLAKYYNGAMITGETNTTSYLLEVCYKLGHRFIYQDQDVEDLSGRYANKFGYKTKQNNRTYMIDLFKIAFRDNPRCINDYETICEMENFQIVKHNSGKEKAEAVGDGHDDLVMAACGFYLCRGAQTCALSVATSNKKKSIDELDWELTERRRQSDNKMENVYQVWE